MPIFLQEGALKEGDDGWDWSTSATKAILLRMIQDKELPTDSTSKLKPREVYQLEPIFSEECDPDSKTWGSRLRSLYNLAEKQMREEKEVPDAIDGNRRDSHLCPKNSHDTLGLPHWKGSAAYNIIKEVVEESFADVGDGMGLLHIEDALPTDKRLKMIMADNPGAFKNWSVSAIKRKIHQEVRTSKRHHHRQWMAKQKREREGKERKMQEGERKKKH
jgi:hypothetical protein